jgi:hypothetical protein
MPMSSGKYLRSCESRTWQGIVLLHRKLAIWCRAWTPASVLPLPNSSTGSPKMREIAVSSLPWMVDSVPDWRCQPL